MYRFQKGDSAIGYIYNKPATGNDKWTDEIKTLNFSFNALASVSSLALVTAISSLLF
jgi:hypothetical protein